MRARAAATLLAPVPVPVPVLAALVLVLALVLASALIWLGADTATIDPVQTLRQARVAETVDGRRAASVAILLPLHWDVRHKGSSGSAEFADRKSVV